MSTDAVRGLIGIAVRHGHDRPNGRRANTLASLTQVHPEHPNHARRQIAIADRLTRELAERLALSSQHGGIPSPDQAQRPGDRA